MSRSRVTPLELSLQLTDLGTLLRCRFSLGSFAGLTDPVAERGIMDPQLLGDLRDLTAGLLHTRATESALNSSLNLRRLRRSLVFDMDTPLRAHALKVGVRQTGSTSG